MTPVKVKICGITKRKDLNNAVAAGADALGFVVGAPDSPRNLSLETAVKLLRNVPPFVATVMVTVPEALDVLEENCRKLNPNVIQIHGEKLDNATLIRKRFPNTPIIKAIGANSSNALDRALAESELFDGVLLDSLSEREYGGTGGLHDWTLSRQIRQAIRPAPLILAGGLNPENVAAAVRFIHPYAVDVSSGVEMHPGIKDNQKMIAFVKNAKEV